MGKRDSHFDHIRPHISGYELRPYFEDRVLVKRLPQPTQEGSLHLPEKRNGIGQGDFNPQGLQRGLVVALGPGASGIWKDGEVRMMRNAAPIESKDEKNTGRYAGPAYEAVEMPGHVKMFKRHVEPWTRTPEFVLDAAKEQGVSIPPRFRFGGGAGCGGHVSKDELVPRWRAPFECKVGDTVLYERWPPHEFIVDGETYTALFEEQSIFAVLEVHFQ